MPQPIDLNKRHYMFTDDIKFLQKAIVFNPDGDRFLLLKRASYHPTRPNEWDLPGGNVAFGQNNMDSLLQEIKEEVHIDVKDVRPLQVKSKYENNIYYLYIGYTAHAINTDITLSKEHTEYKWVSKNEFLELTLADFLRELISLI